MVPLLVHVLLAAVVAVSGTHHCNYAKCRDDIIKFYRDIGCTPVKRPGECCPHRFDCTVNVNRTKPVLHPRTFDGTVVRPGEFKSLVAILVSQVINLRPGTRYGCTGTLITKRFVLTAAHCFNAYHHVQQKHPAQFKNLQLRVHMVTGVNPAVAMEKNFVATEDTQLRTAKFDGVVLFTDSLLPDDTHACDVYLGLRPERPCKPGQVGCKTVSCYSLIRDDIALVRSDREFLVNDFVAPAALLGEAVPASFLTRATALGYGGNGLGEHGDNNEHGRPNVLSRIPVAAGGTEFCESLFDWATFTEKRSALLRRYFVNSWCTTGWRAKHQCPGDSGGPLMLRTPGYEVSIGVAGAIGKYGTNKEISSGKPACGGWKQWSLYADVGAYKGWIVNQTRGDNVSFVSISDITAALE